MNCPSKHPIQAAYKGVTQHYPMLPRFLPNAANLSMMAVDGVQQVLFVDMR